MPSEAPEAPSDGAITRATREYPEEEIFGILEPEVRTWFKATFGSFTPPQRYAVKELHERHNVLISSPTGSGKTLSAFLAAINELIGLAKRGELTDRVHVLYVSPLKALNNDIHRNLEEPLAEIAKVFEAEGAAPPAIRVAVRTGDTPQSERQKMTRKPPHILITTPESLAIMLNAPKMREHLKSVRWMIVDEVHALADNKRGTHLAVSLERLADIAERDPVRVGLSATVAPLDDVARFVAGASAAGPRPCMVVDVSFLKKTKLRVLAPVADLVMSNADETLDGLYALLDDLIDKHRTTLIFTNTRAGTERVVFHLKERFGEKYAEIVEAHHGSMSRERRLTVEERLKRGELRCVVCSTSLELGIDIGYVDLVVLLGSPKSTAKALQRIGRAGHRLHAVSEGDLVAMDRDELVECAVLAKAAKEGRIDAVRTVDNALDVLAQHLLGMALNDVCKIDDAYDLVRRAYPYRDLPRADFDRVMRYLSGGYPELEERRVYSKIWMDEERGEFGKRGRFARPIYYTNMGVIPDQEEIQVFAGDEYVGTMQEEFAERLVEGDIFVLGGRTYEWRYARGQKGTVARAEGKAPTVPTWMSEQMPLSPDVARDVRAFRGEVARRLAENGHEETVAWIAKEYPVEADLAKVIADYVADQLAYARVPDETEVVVEETVDEDRRATYVFHTMAGRGANEALARAFARRVQRMKRGRLVSSVHDNGFTITIAKDKRITEYEMRSLFLIDIARDLELALDGSEILKRRFRHVAGRSYLILRNYRGRTMSVGKQQVQSHILWHTLRKIGDEFPVIKETFREVMEDALDLAAAERFLGDILARRLRVHYLRDRTTPSPFAFGLVVTGSSDYGAMEGRKARVREFQAKVKHAIATGGHKRHVRTPPPRRAWSEPRGKRKV